MTSGIRILIVDDLLATGGTMKTATELIGLCRNVTAIEVFVLIELEDLNGKDLLPNNINVCSLLQFDK